MDDRNTRILRILVGYSRRAVRGAVIYQNDLVGVAGFLTKDRIHALPQIFFDIICRNNDLEVITEGLFEPVFREAAA